jgi:pimeloyl-ACP methyl ester carboxylesterase
VPDLFRTAIAGSLAGSLASSALAGGVTIVTHGFNADMTWVNAMADAIARRAGGGATPGVNVTRINLVVTQGTSGLVVTQTPIAVAPEATFTTGEFVVALDWTAIDGFQRGVPEPDVGEDATPTQTVAQAVFAYLQTWNYGGRSVLAHPVHVIGHSRGGALVASLARTMGESGVWVDQLTTLDPVPVSLFGDAAARVVSTVVFADNIWQNVAAPSGSSLAGAFNQQMGNLGSGNHSLIHTWYYGTIDPLATGDGECSSCINPVWYTTDIDANTRSQSGFWYSRIAGLGGGGNRTGTQARAGLLNTLGGTAIVGTGGRLAITTAQPAWPNVFQVQTDKPTLAFGESNTTDFYYQSTGAGVQISVYADDDRNPAAGGTLLGTASFGAAANPTLASVPWTVTPAARTQPYNIYVAITGAGGRTRIDFDSVGVTVTRPPCPADFNADAFVDDADFVIFAAAYNLLDCADPAMPAGCPADLNRDSVVDDADFVIFATAYETLVCP